jgi:hypothetical protein
MIFGKGMGKWGRTYGKRAGCRGECRKGRLAMTDSEGTPQETELGPESSTGEPESSTGEATADTEAPAYVKPEAEEKGLQEAEKKGLTADYQIAGEKAGAADYQTRLEKFDNVETPVPVVSLPVTTPSSEKSDEA